MNNRQTAFLFFVCTCVAMASNFSYAFASTYLNNPVDEFKANINESFIKWNQHLSSSDIDLVFNLISNIMFVGMLFGMWCSPFFNDRFGRKKGFIISGVGCLLAAAISVVAVGAHQPELLLLGRFLVPLCSAIGYQAGILYIQESSPTHLRGRLSFLNDIGCSSLMLLGMAMGTDQLLGKHIIWLLAVGMIPATLALMVPLLLVPETPKYLFITQGNREAAARSIRYFQGRDADVDSVLKQFEIEVQTAESAALSWKDVKKIFTERHLRKALTLSCAGLQNTVPLWTIIMNSTEFLTRADVHDWKDNLAKWTSTSMTIVYCCATIIGGSFVARFGRRPLLLTCSCVNASCIVLFVVFDKLETHVNGLKYGCVAVLLLFGASYGSGLGAIAWFNASELTPQKYRSIVQSMTFTFNTVMIVITSFSTMPLYNSIGSYAFLILFTFPSLISLTYLFKCFPETIGKEIHDIVEQLKQK